jgi:hypothetical protein
MDDDCDHELQNNNFASLDAEESMEFSSLPLLRIFLGHSNILILLATKPPSHQSTNATFSPQA